ncbi:MAG: winged helix-turn-helix transcriptional regulator [Acidilobus sp.]
MIDEADSAILRIVADKGPLTLSEISRELSWSKSMIHRRLKKLAELGLVSVRDVGGVVLFSPGSGRSSSVAFIGILRASEYPYVVPFLRRLRDRFGHVEVRVYDDAYQEALDLASGRIQLAFAPAVTLMTMYRLTRGGVYIVGGGSSGGAAVIRGRSGEGHATTRMSSMELCAEKGRLQPPRVYALSGYEILSLVRDGRVREGVVWEPYVSLARRSGLQVESCELETCCLLGANASVEGMFDLIGRLAEESISKGGSVDIDAYSRLVGIPYELVADSVKGYEFLDRPNPGLLKKMVSPARGVMLPDSVVKESVRYP